MAKGRVRSRRMTKHPPELQVRTPDVILDFLFNRGMLFVSIENIGDSPAFSVTTTFDRRITALGGTQDLNSLRLFHNIEFLAPHKSIVTFLDSSTAYFRRAEPKKITVKISYKDSGKRPYSATIHHDLSIYEDISYVTPSTEPDLT